MPNFFRTTKKYLAALVNKKSAALAAVAITLAGCVVADPYPSYADYPGGPYYAPSYYQPAPAVVVSPPPVGFFFGDFHDRGRGRHFNRGHYRHH
ncbi:MAG: hypothetical protein PHY92_07070 [Alphaproteobacteria bacterium]|nr:hypothetical protein [Alphaproteobacteria bacterium]